MVFENRALRRISGPKRDDVTGWRKLHNEELHNFYPSPSMIKDDEMDRGCSTNWREEE
jgi:hypothetical protein